MIARPRSDFRSIATLRLLRFSTMNPALSPFTKGLVSRLKSPPWGFSILTTSAPRSASSIAQ